MPLRKTAEKDPIREIVRILESYDDGTPTRADTGSKANIDDWGE